MPTITRQSERRQFREQSRQLCEVMLGLVGEVSLSRQSVGKPPWTGIVGSKSSYRSETIIKFAKIRRARHYVVARIEGISAQVVPHLQIGPGVRHNLHQAHGAFE